MGATGGRGGARGGLADRHELGLVVLRREQREMKHKGTDRSKSGREAERQRGREAESRLDTGKSLRRVGRYDG